MDAFLTPNALFFKRNHLPVPDVKAEDYLLEGGWVGVDIWCICICEERGQMWSIYVCCRVGVSIER